MSNALLLSALLVTCLSFAVPAQAKQSTSASAPAAQSPALTAEQKAYVKARDKCLQRRQDEKIPRSQTHTFFNACLKENGFSKAVQLPHPSMPSPPQPGK
jgi:hypothetical protein